MRKLLLPFSWLYGVVMACRNKAFDWGWLPVEAVGVPVISVGNLTAGGTGKTPFVEMLVRECQSREKRVAVVSRGYGRYSEGVVIVSDGKKLLADAGQGGDEPVQIAHHNPTAIVVVGERRVDAARTAKELGAEVIIVDDGFQHRYLHRDLNFVVINARKDIQRIPVLPAGDRREFLSGLRRADVIAYSRWDEGAAKNGWTEDLSSSYGRPAIRFRYQVRNFIEVPGGKLLTAERMKNLPVFLFSGIGDHAGFVSQMTNAGLKVVGEMRFGDHHHFTDGDVRALISAAAAAGAGALLTTEKDAARLTGNRMVFESAGGRIPLYAAGIVVDIIDGEHLLAELIDSRLGTKPA
jgi:tetraacyldisaccharide 4'-kinase